MIRSLLNCFYLCVLYTSRKLLHVFIQIDKSWVAAWNAIGVFVKNAFWQILRWHLLHFTLMLIVVLYALKFPQFHNIFSYMSCEHQNIMLKIYTPVYFAPEDEITFHMIIQNQLAHQIKQIQVGIVPAKDLWFPQSNVISVDHLPPNAILSKDLTARLPRFIGLNKSIEVRAFIKTGTSTKECLQRVEITQNKWHHIFVLLSRSMPEWADITIRVLGYTATVLTSLLALSGKWREVLIWLTRKQENATKLDR